MGYFQVTKIWCEKVANKKCYMYRFEKIAVHERSWWAPDSSIATAVAPANSIRAVEAACIYCNIISEQIYTAGWMCLNENCPAFWSINLAPPSDDLQYTSNFLDQRTPWDPSINPPYPLRPRLMAADADNPTFPVSRICWKGIVCPQCGCCNARQDWHRWKCQTPGCGFTHTVPLNALSARAVADAHDSEFDGHAIPSNKHHEPVTKSYRFTKNYRIHTYTIPNCGVVAHFQANDYVNRQPNGPDDMFLQLQREDMGLRRLPLNSSMCTYKLRASGPMFKFSHLMQYLDPL